MHAFISELIKDGPVLTDGAWGSQLLKAGLPPGECPDAWNITHPATVEDIARRYVEAGSRVILTNTFGANRFILAKYGLADKVAEINQQGVAISKKAAGSRAAVFASMGPSGKLLVMRGSSAVDLQTVFQEQAWAIARAGADGIVVETMMDLNEAVIAATAAKQTGLPVIASLVFDAGKDKDRTLLGQTIEQVVAILDEIDVDGIGANCGLGIEAFIPICKRLRAATDLPLWMKPNAGKPEIVEGEAVYATSVRDFVRLVPELIQAGANFIGGCCGTDAEFIRETSRVLNPGVLS